MLTPSGQHLLLNAIFTATSLNLIGLLIEVLLLIDGAFAVVVIIEVPDQSVAAIIYAFDYGADHVGLSRRPSNGIYFGVMVQGFDYVVRFSFVEK